MVSEASRPSANLSKAPEDRGCQLTAAGTGNQGLAANSARVTERLSSPAAVLGGAEGGVAHCQSSTKKGRSQRSFMILYRNERPKPYFLVNLPDIGQS